MRAVICLLWTPDRRLKDKLQKLCPIVELLGDPNEGFARQAWKALRVCWRERTALFQGWMYHGCVLATIFWWLTGAGNAIFWAIHSSGIVEGDHKLLRSVELLGLGVICRLTGAKVMFCGENSQRVHLEKWHWTERNAKVLPNGINISRFAPSNEIYRQVRRELGISDRALVLGYIGRWHPDKNVGSLCQALASLGSLNFELVVIFCGHGLSMDNREYADAVTAASKRIRCISLGEVPDTSRIIPAFDFLCLSSLREAFPLVLCEALACGVPCVTTDVGDCRNIVNGLGRVVPPGDLHQLAQALVEYANILRHDAAVDIRIAAREWATVALDEKIMTQRYLSLLDSESRSWRNSC